MSDQVLCDVDDATALEGWVRDEEEAGASTSEAERVRRSFERVRDGARFRLEPLADIELDLGPQWLIEGLMPATGLQVLYGAPGTGKSFLALSAALHVATGRSWGGRDVTKAAVVYVASEGGRNFRKRVVAARKALDVPADARFALVAEAPNLGGQRANTKELIAQIRAQTDALGWEPQLIVIDTLSRSIEDLNESSSTDIMDFVRNAERISAAFGAVVMPVHHCGKDESKGMRGSSALHGSADAEWMVSRDPETGARQLSVEKMKDGPDRGRLRYDLVDWPLGRDEDGREITTCVAKVVDAPVEPGSDATGRRQGKTQEEAVLAAMRLLAEIEGEPTPEGGSLPTGVKMVTRSRLKQVIESANLLGDMKPDALRTALSRAVKALAAKDLVAATQDHVCPLRPSAKAAPRPAIPPSAGADAPVSDASET